MEHGIITSVNYKEGVITCNVQAIRVSTEYREVPVMKDFSGLSQMPKPGQKAVMGKLADGTRIILGFLARRDSYPDDLKPDEFSIQLDDKTKITVTKNGDNFDVDISASGKINLTSEKDATIESKGHLQFNADSVDFDTSG